MLAVSSILTAAFERSAMRMSGRSSIKLEGKLTFPSRLI